MAKQVYPVANDSGSIAVFTPSKVSGEIGDNIFSERKEIRECPVPGLR